jgi:Heparinase II/III-like protein
MSQHLSQHLSQHRAVFPTFRQLRLALLACPASNAVPQYDWALLGQQPHLQRPLREAWAVAAAALTTPLAPLGFAAQLAYHQTGERLAFETAYHQRRQRLSALALVALLGNGSADIDSQTDNYTHTGIIQELEATIWEILNEYSWCLPAHLPWPTTDLTNGVQNTAFGAHYAIVDLFAANTAHALAEISALLTDQLNAFLQSRIITELERRSFAMFEQPSRFTWESKQNNWSAACAGGIGMAAMLTISDPERLAAILQRCLDAFEVYLSGFSQEGGSAEGIAYWLYGFGYFSYFSDMLFWRTAGHIDLLKLEQVQAIARFPGHLDLGGGHFINFSDAPEYCPLHSGLASHLNTRLGLQLPNATSGFHRDHCYRWGHVARNVFWSSPPAAVVPVPPPSTAWLPDLGWLVARDCLTTISKQPALTLAFAVKGGNNNEPHNHNDLGHFIMHLAGESLLCDLGRGVYNQHYFSDAGYQLLHRGSHGHSVPIIDGVVQQSTASAQAKLLDFVANTTGASAVQLSLKFDLSSAYTDPEQKPNVYFTRQYDWNSNIQGAVLRLHDVFIFNINTDTNTDINTKPPIHQVEERFISLYPPIFGPGTVTWQGSSAQLTLAFAAPDWAATLTVTTTQAHLGEALTVYQTSLRASSTAAQLEFCGHFTMVAIQPAHADALPAGDG